ncbi:MAG: SpoIIE family protein phosphatase [Clostridiales bacterium]|nr:SpoIIE family protein phosphatase [Candidatus Coliplasma equi]
MSFSEILSSGYFKLGIAALIPVFASALLYTLDTKTAFGKINGKIKQLIFGIVFGGIAILGTEWGIPMNGAQVNCRDAAVIIAGIGFGGPAGIIAGFIGGIERWFAVYWGVGSFTRVACSASTIIAGLFAALLRKYLFEGKKPGFIISFAVGVVIEVFHLTMVFITNMSSPIEAMAVVKACSIPMVTANGISVLLSAMVISLHDVKKEKESKTKASISQKVQKSMILAVILAFIATSGFVFTLQDTIADSQTDTLLDLAITEAADDILDASDENLLAVTRQIAIEANESNLPDIALKYGVAEISLVGSTGHIWMCTEPQFIGYDMAAGEQSAEFLCLLGDTEEYVQEYGPISFDENVMRKYAGVKTKSGFVQVGFDATSFQKDIDSQVIDITRNRHVGKTGYILIFDARSHIVSLPKGREKTEFDGFKIKTYPRDRSTFETVIAGEEAFCKCSMSEGYYILSVLPTAEALQLRNVALYVNTFMEVLVFAILFGLIYLLIKKIVVSRIHTVNDSLAKISAGDLDETVDVRSTSEFDSLSDDINSTVGTLKKYISDAEARIDKELQFAKDIQSSALPSVFPAFPKRKDFDIYAMMDPAKEVGGDFYDFYLTGTDTLNFLIADVSGKGIPAAMFMMRAKTQLKSLTETGMAVNDVFTHGNASLCEGNDAGMFVTGWEGCIDLTTGLVKYANAGHNPPLIRRNGRFDYLTGKAGFVLAGMDGVKYKLQEFQLEPGDAVFLYTDGVTEATNAKNELYGEERLLSAINSQEFENVNEICNFIKADVDAFVDEAPQFDDITMVAFEYIGTPPAPSISFEKASLADIAAVTEFVEGELEKVDCPMKTVTQMSIAVDELYSNIVFYGYPKDAPGRVTVEFISRDDPKSVSLRFIDEGVPYNPMKKEDPDVTLSASERKIGGLGIFMVKKMMDDMRYEYENEKNILTITKML